MNAYLVIQYFLFQLCCGATITTTDDASAYDVLSNVGPMPYPLSDMAITTFQQNIFVDGNGPRAFIVGGCTSNEVCEPSVNNTLNCNCKSVTNKCLYFSFQKEKWFTCSPAPISRYRAGGRDVNNNIVTQIDRYDTLENSWTTVATWHNATSDGVTFSTESRYVNFVSGYTSSGNPTPYMTIYDTTMNSFSMGPAMRVARGDAASVQIGNLVYVIGGWSMSYFVHSPSTRPTITPSAVSKSTKPSFSPIPPSSAPSSVFKSTKPSLSPTLTSSAPSDVPKSSKPSLTPTPAPSAPSDVPKSSKPSLSTTPTSSAPSDVPKSSEPSLTPTPAPSAPSDVPKSSKPSLSPSLTVLGETLVSSSSVSLQSVDSDSVSLLSDANLKSSVPIKIVTQCPALSQVEVYNVVTKTWSTIKSLLYSRADLAVSSFGDDVYTFGGEIKSFADYSCSRSEVLSYISRYSPQKNAWKLQESLPMGRFRFGAATYNNSDGMAIYLFGGQGPYNYSTHQYPVEATTLKFVPVAVETSPPSTGSPAPLSQGDIAGIVIAVLVGVGAVALAVCGCIVWRRGYYTHRDLALARQETEAMTIDKIYDAESTEVEGAGIAMGAVGRRSAFQGDDNDFDDTLTITLQVDNRALFSSERIGSDGWKCGPGYGDVAGEDEGGDEEPLHEIGGEGTEE